MRRVLVVVLLAGLLVPGTSSARDAVRDNARWPVTLLQAQRATRAFHRMEDAGLVGVARNIRCELGRRGAVCLYDFHRGDDGSEWANSDTYDEKVWVHAYGPTRLMMGARGFVHSERMLRRR